MNLLCVFHPYLIQLIPSSRVKGGGGGRWRGAHIFESFNISQAPNTGNCIIRRGNKRGDPFYWRALTETFVSHTYSKGKLERMQGEKKKKKERKKERKRKEKEEVERTDWVEITKGEISRQ